MNNEQIVKRAFFLAYEASDVVGMGVLAAKPGVTEDEVWQIVYNAPNEAWGDYVFGRMMKLSITWNKEIQVNRGNAPRFDYQSWAWKYKSGDDLILAAMYSLENQG